MSALRVILSSFLIAALAACGDNTSVPPVPQCSDGVDNDTDGNIDFPADPGCANAEDDDESGGNSLPKCNDGQDNDGDGKTDYPNDPGCFDAFADDETDDCPSGANCAACSDGMDNDENGVTDYPNDPGCKSAADDSEFLDNPNACGQGLMVKQLPPSGMDMGMLTSASTSQLVTACGGGAGAPAIAYLFILQEPKVMVASTDNPTTTADTVLDLRSAMCSDEASHIACSDNVSSANSRSTLTRSLQPGSYYLIVEGKNATATGDYEIKVEFFQGEGEACATDPECGPGLVCRTPVNGSSMVCSQPVCNDGLDDDGDGKIDFPADPGCSAATDATEDDDCPNGVNCPQCGNALDDDMDGLTDFPADTSCTSASTNNEACQESDPILVATGPQTMGTTSGATNDYRPPAGSFNGHACSTSGTHSAPDVAVQLDLPALTKLSARVTNHTGGSPYDSAIALLDSTCGGTAIECYDSPTLFNVTNLAAGRYYMMMDGWGSSSGPFILHLSGSIVDGESCEMPLAQSGALTCGSGYACRGTVGSRTCQPAECNDGVDNNNDLATDYPEDPGCASPSDNTEETVCPGATCPVCSDGLDNDTDGFIDYPNDTGCIAASANNEGCAGEVDPVVNMTTGSISDTLVGASDNHDPSCVSSNFADKVFTVDLPTMQELIIDTEGSSVDTVLSLMTSACTEPAIACDDDGGEGTGDSKIVRNFLPGGKYTIAVDSDSSTLSTFNLNVSGTIVPAASCEGALAQAGAIKCGTGFACLGAAGSRTCQPSECLDGLDNNGDGKVDFPADPGCSGPSDGVEDLVCPGPNCPECGDGVDNDSDGRVDFPADDGCTHAGSDIEGCYQQEPIGAITQKVINGTTAGAQNDSYPSCGSATTHGAPDLAYELEIPTNMDTLNIEVTGLSQIHSVFKGTCGGTPVSCSDPNLMTVSNLTPGMYYVVVDGSGTASGAFTMTTTGTISPTESCEGPLVAAGAFTCSTGYSCKGIAGSRTCQPALCDDGLDNNGDGTIDFPNDPGCVDASDDVEDTVCPGATCPLCADGADNDGDTLIDYPMDTSCFAASSNNEACAQSEPVPAITTQITNGTTVGQVNDFTPTCSSSSHNAPDVALQLDIPGMMSTLTLHLTGFDTAHTLLDSTCGGTAIACSDPAVMTRTNVAPGRYYVVVDGWSTAANSWSLNTTGTIVTGESCESPLVDAGAFKCAAGHACQGTPGSRTCQVAQCNDGMDNNGDGLVDYPADPSCTSTSDGTEETVCPGPNCPACFDMMDNDMDGQTDHPADTGCPAAANITEACTTSEMVGQITSMVTSGTTVGATNNHTPSCGSSSHSAADLAYQLVIPANLTSLSLNLSGFDTAHSLYGASCGGTPIACSDPALMSLGAINAGTYYVMIEGWGSSTGTWTLTTTGTIAAGQTCEGSLADSGALTCATGTTCAGMPGLRTCQ